MRFLGIRRNKYNPDCTISGILSVLIIAIGLTLVSPAESNAQLCGDANNNGDVNLGDIAFLIVHLYMGGPDPVFADACDVDSISGITNHDIQFLSEYLFPGGPEPYCPPYPPDSILPVTTDTLEVRYRTVPPGQGTGKVDLWLQSEDTLRAISFAFQYSCATSSITLDSISFVGTAYDANLANEDTVYTGLGMGAIGITSFYNLPSNQLTADSGLVASLWFSVTPAAYTQYINIDTTTTPPSNITIFSRRTTNTGDKLIAFVPTIVGLTPQLIESVTPRQNALDVAVTADIIARFGYDMDPETIMDTTFLVYGQCSGPHVGMITYDAPTQTAMFNPTVDFQPGELVTVILSKGIQYQGGPNIDSAFLWTFMTEVSRGTGRLSTPALYGSGNWHDLCTADFDGDGDIDIAAVDNESNLVSIFHNSGTGAFDSPTGYSCGLGPNSIVAADFDKDGDIDLATANWGNTVSVLQNDGSGAFLPAVNYSVSAYIPQSLAAADVTGDGAPDLVVVNHSQDSPITMLENNGDGSFAAPAYINGIFESFGLCVADLDNDGDNDIAVTIYNRDSLRVLMNTGNGTFGPPTTFAVGDYPVAVLAADFDADGDNDLVVSNWSANNVSILLNIGGGTFTTPANYESGNGPWWLAAADLDADGDVDIVTGEQISNSVTVLKNHGDGTFVSVATYNCGSGIIAVDVGDVDGDGDVDVAAAAEAADSMVILRNDGDFIVQNTNDAGESSLRWAIERSNADMGSDTILFGVSGTVELTSPLPALVDDSTVILGSSAPGGDWSVILDGSAISGGGDGLVVQSRDNVIEGLTIKNFPGNGITVDGALSIRNRLTRNLIYENDGLAIDLGADGVTANDFNDVDTGPNDLLNFPVIDSAVCQIDGFYTIFGVAPNSSLVELYLAHPAGDIAHPPDSSGHGEAVVFVDSTYAATSGPFSMTVSASVDHFSQITATAIDSFGNTSEFSQNITLVPRTLMVVVYSPVNIIVTDPDGLRFGKDSLGNDITEIPDGHYFITPNDSVVIDIPKPGDYLIGFVTEAGTMPGETFSAIIKIDGTENITLVANGLVPSSGQMANFNYEVEEGYQYINADANRDGIINIGDAVFIVSYVFRGGPAPDPVYAADANCDRVVNVGDAVYIVGYIFRGGPEPCAFEP